MCPHMFLQILCLPTTLITNNTLKWSLISMHPHMYFKIATMWKLFTTYGTFIWLICRMCFHMPRKFCCCTKHFVTNRTSFPVCQVFVCRFFLNIFHRIAIFILVYCWWRYCYTHCLRLLNYWLLYLRMYLNKIYKGC